jgi:hypothetical protein
VKSLPGALATLNKNFIALSFAGVLWMLHESGCDHLLMLSSLASSSDALLLDEIPAEVQKVVRQLVSFASPEEGAQVGKLRSVSFRC